MILNCVIIDDEPIARKLLQEYIEETDFLNLVGVAENPLKAISVINSQETDLIFLDINMPKMTGLEFLKSAANLPMVIMTTAYGQYALEGFEMAVIDYLVKPFSLERFMKAVQKAMDLKILKSKNLPAAVLNEDHFFVKCDGKIERLFYKELLYVESMANYVTLYTHNRKLITYLTLKGIQEKLPSHKFMQVHKSYLVNLDHINTIDGHMLLLGDTKITIGPSFVDEVIHRILKDKFIKRSDGK